MNSKESAILIGMLLCLLAAFVVMEKVYSNLQDQVGLASK
jgi:hypothetical protein